MFWNAIRLFLAGVLLVFIILLLPLVLFAYAVNLLFLFLASAVCGLMETVKEEVTKEGMDEDGPQDNYVA